MTVGVTQPGSSPGDTGLGEAADRHIEEARQLLGSTGRLSELPFSDLYFSTACQQRWIVFPGHLVQHKLPDKFDGEIKRLNQILAPKLGCFEAGAQSEFQERIEERTYRVSAIASADGNFWVLRRLLDPPPPLAAYDFDDALFRQLTRVAQPGPGGLVLIGGPGGVGKSTFAGGLLIHWLKTYGGLAAVFEDTTELKLAGEHGKLGGRCFQVRVKQRSLAQELKASLRWNPRYIMLGEVRDSDAVEQLIVMSLIGHLCIGVFHTGTPEQAVTRVLTLLPGNERSEANDALAQSLRALMVLSKPRVPGRITELYRPEMVSLFVEGNDAETIRTHLQRRDLGQLKNLMRQQAARRAVTDAPGLTRLRH